MKAGEISQRDHVGGFLHMPQVAPGQRPSAAASFLSSSSCHTRLHSLPSAGRSCSSSACKCFHGPSSPLYLLLFCHIAFSHAVLGQSAGVGCQGGSTAQEMLSSQEREQRRAVWGWRGRRISSRLRFCFQ